MRRMSPDGRAMLVELEGSRSTVYRDVAGLPTIGVGHLLTRSELTSGKIWISGTPAEYSEGLSNEEIDGLFLQDLDKYEECVWAHTTGLEPHEFDALVSFAFNVGCWAFSNSTLVKKIAEDRKDMVPEELRRWVYSGGQKIEGLVKRREREVLRWLGQ